MLFRSYPWEPNYFQEATGVPLNGLLTRFDDGPAMAIPVFHGSPHKFDKFDMSKIGTGEGAQAYGHGLYFADNPNVAKWYGDKLTVGENYVDGALLDPFNPRHNLASILEQESGSVDAARETLEMLSQRGGSKSVRETASQSLDLLNKGEMPKIDYVKTEGNLYNINLRWPDAAREAADPLGPQHFLDWDKPLSEQSPVVQDAIAAMQSRFVSKPKPQHWVETCTTWLCGLVVGRLHLLRPQRI